MPSVQSSGASAGSPGADGVLIVGGGQAAVHLASSLRELGWQAAVTIVSEEDPRSLPAAAAVQGILVRKCPADNARVPLSRTLRARPDHRADRARVTDVRAAAPGRPGVATTEGGDRLEFGHLALATGARPRLLAVPGADLAGICYLRDVGHALELRERLAAAQRVLVVGGGFIGLEAAAAATAMGKTVTVVEAADRLIGRVVAPVISDFYAAAHRRRGVRVLLGTAVSRFEGTGPADTGPANTGPASTGGTVTGAHLSDGGFAPADLVIIGIGAEPRTELAERLGLACAGGIVVDAFARTSDPAIVAVGRLRGHPASRGRRRRPWSASSRTGTRSTTPRSPRPPWPGCPRRTTRRRGSGPTRARSSCRSPGCPAGFDQAVLRGDPGQERFSVLYYRDGRLLAVHAVNCPRDYLAVRRALAAGQEIPAESAADCRTSRCARRPRACSGRGRVGLITSRAAMPQCRRPGTAWRRGRGAAATRVPCLLLFLVLSRSRAPRSGSR